MGTVPQKIRAARIVGTSVTVTVFDWNACTHDWDIAAGDMDSTPDTDDVKCSKCGCMGQLNLKTGVVYWPTT